MKQLKYIIDAIRQISPFGCLTCFSSRRASRRCPDKAQRSEQTWLEVHKVVSEEDGARYPQSTNASGRLISYRLHTFRKLQQLSR